MNSVEDDEDEDRSSFVMSRTWAAVWVFFYLTWYIAAPRLWKWFGRQEAAAWSADILSYTTLPGLIVGCFLINRPTKRTAIIFFVLSVIHVLLGGYLV